MNDVDIRIVPEELLKFEYNAFKQYIFVFS